MVAGLLIVCHFVKGLPVTELAELCTCDCYEVKAYLSYRITLGFEVRPKVQDAVHPRRGMAIRVSIWLPGAGCSLRSLSLALVLSFHACFAKYSGAREESSRCGHSCINNFIVIFVLLKSLTAAEFMDTLGVYF